MTLYGDPNGGKWHRREIVGYGGMHLRIKKEKGSAAEHPCVDCGSAAAEWSYDRLDPEELTSEQGLRYSAKAEHYVARCRSCHRLFDRREVSA